MRIGATAASPFPCQSSYTNQTRYRLKRRAFLTQSTLGVCSLSMSGKASAELSPTDLRPTRPIGQAEPSRPITKDNVARCRVANPRAVKILQCTDVHLHCDRDRHGDKADQLTREDIKRLVDKHQPDLIAFTGDVWHDPAPGKSEEGQLVKKTTYVKVESGRLSATLRDDVVTSISESENNENRRDRGLTIPVPIILH